MSWLAWNVPSNSSQGGSICSHSFHWNELFPSFPWILSQPASQSHLQTLQTEQIVGRAEWRWEGAARTVYLDEKNKQKKCALVRKKFPGCSDEERESRGLKEVGKKGTESDRGVHMLAHPSTAPASFGKLGAAGAALVCRMHQGRGLTPGLVVPLPVIFATSQARCSFQFVDSNSSFPHPVEGVEASTNQHSSAESCKCSVALSGGSAEGWTVDVLQASCGQSKTWKKSWNLGKTLKKWMEFHCSYYKLILNFYLDVGLAPPPLPRSQQCYASVNRINQDKNYFSPWSSVEQSI